MQGASVSLKGIGKAFGSTPVLNAVDLEVEAGEFLTLLGPSGCGKSTLLRLIAGFETQSCGTMEIGGRSIDGLRPKERGLSMVFQSYALYPHMSVFDNIAMPLLMRRLSFAQRFPWLGRLVPGSAAGRREIAQKVRDTAALLELDDLLSRRPGQLSGGQRQRVALGRALVAEPSVFLMDEPLSNLDARLRIQMRNELTDLHDKLGITFIYVTHDQVEAMTMSQRVAVMMDGALLQVGTPSEIYAHPVDLRVARFIGTHPINVHRAPLRADGTPELFGRPLPLQVAPAAGHEVTLAIRPEDLRLDFGPSASSSDLRFAARLVKLEDHGADLVFHLRLEAAPSAVILVRADASLRDRLPQTLDAALSVVVPTARLHVFDSQGKAIQPAATSAVPLAAASLAAGGDA